MTQPIDKYTKQGIVRIAQHLKDKITIAKTPANMRMSKNALVELWKGKISESDIRTINPPTMGRSRLPPNPRPKATASSGTQTKTQTTVTTPKRKTQKRKATKNQIQTKSTTNQTNITKFFK